jgi:hypothetical protein
MHQKEAEMAKADWRMRSGSVKEPRLMENIIDDDDEMMIFMNILCCCGIHQWDMLADKDVVSNVNVP